jgi:hypothetical protein
MSGQPHRLAVSAVGMDRAVILATGEDDWCGDAVEPDEAAAYLPHSCDEWMVGSGTTAEVIDSLLQLRAEVDAAIAYLNVGSSR